MAVYHQMGHQSDNLLSETNLAGYRGAILSPVNCTQIETHRTLEICRRIDNFESIFDPQLYYPKSQQVKLLNWSYFPNDVDTADLSSPDWWKQVVDSLAITTREIHPDTVCSPALVPRFFDIDYFSLMSDVSEMLCDVVCPLGIDVLQTVLIGMSDLADYEKVMSIASVISRTPAKGLYIIFVGNTPPRAELNDPEEIKGALRLIQTLNDNNILLLVGYTSSDIILWKDAGADSCATGKFFNLRRFTPSRWDASEEGGGQMAYWFEESLTTFLRESDITRVQEVGLLSDVSLDNPFSSNILANISEGNPWLGISWRFYLHWFSSIEKRISNGEVSPISLLKSADKNWKTLDEKDIYMEERRNDGVWIRQWLRALSEYLIPW